MENLNKYISKKDIAEKICLSILRRVSVIHVSSFVSDARVIIKTILENAEYEDEKWIWGTIDELLKEETIIPEYTVEWIDSEYSVTRQYYLKIVYFDCPAENIKITNEFLESLKLCFPKTKIIIVTPFDYVFYCVDVDDIKDGSNLDLQNHKLEDTYEIFIDDYDEPVIGSMGSYLQSMRVLFKSIFEPIE